MVSEQGSSVFFYGVMFCRHLWRSDLLRDWTFCLFVWLVMEPRVVMTYGRVVQPLHVANDGGCGSVLLAGWAEVFFGRWPLFTYILLHGGESGHGVNEDEVKDSHLEKG